MEIYSKKSEIPFHKSPEWERTGKTVTKRGVQYSYKGVEKHGTLWRCGKGISAFFSTISLIPLLVNRSWVTLQWKSALTGLDQKVVMVALKTKFDVFHRTLYNAFAEIPQKDLPKGKQIVTSCYVERDGKGDFYSAIALAKGIKEALPDNTVKLLAMGDPVHENKLKLPESKNPNKKIEGTVFFETTLQDPVMAKVKQDIESSDVYLDVSFPINIDLFKQYRKENANKVVQVHEYDQVNPGRNEASLQVRLGADSRAAEGLILLSTTPKYQALDELKNEALKNFLFGTNTPSKTDVSNYKKMHAPHLAYLHTTEKAYPSTLIYMMAASHANEKNKTIDLFMPINAIHDVSKPLDRNRNFKLCCCFSPGKSSSIA